MTLNREVAGGPGVLEEIVIVAIIIAISVSTPYGVDATTSGQQWQPRVQNGREDKSLTIRRFSESRTSQKAAARLQRGLGSIGKRIAIP
jgi:hypothetical protein